MEECSNGSLAKRTECILTYSGSTTDIIINYIIFAIDLVAVYLVVVACWSAQQPHRRRLILTALFCLGFVVIFQIILCWIVACSGISVIWCAICGWMLLELRQRQQRKLRESQQQQQQQQQNQLTPFTETIISILIVGTLLLNFGVIIYYAVEAPPITTVAHVAAIVLGILLSFLSKRLHRNSEYREHGGTHVMPTSGSLTATDAANN